MTTVEALKTLYTALGGESSDIENVSTTVGVLNMIGTLFEGKGNATVNSEAVANIAAVAENITGGGSESNSIVFTDNILVGVSAIQNAFNSSYKSYIKKAVVPDTTNVIYTIAFQGCSGLEEVAIPNNVTEIQGGAFQGCSSLPSITLSDSLTAINDGAFQGCSSLSSIVFPSSLTSIGQSAFGGCSSLTSITIPENVTSIGQNAFSGCSNLTEIIINKSEGSISGAPWGATNATIVWTG